MFENVKDFFPMFKNNKEMQGNSFVYLDNAATSFKPQCVIDAINDYYSKYSVNSHRGDYDVAYHVDVMVDTVREKTAKFINADKKEIVFTSGTTMSLNLISYGYAEKYLKPGDEILITEAEHASNVLPWFRLRSKGIIINFIPLNNEGRVTLEAVENSITKNTKMISIAQISNVLGYLVDVKEICKIAHKHNVLVSVDGAQSVPHIKIDVKDLDCDFLSFSCHKMCGPTGLGVLYGKYELLEMMDPFFTGGGNNATFDMCGDVQLLHTPEKFEAGTLNLSSIFGFNATLDFLNQFGMENIEKRERELKEYAVNKLKENKNLIIYNPTAETGIITLNYKGIFAQDEATYLNSKGICVRSGQHCAKILNEFLKTPATVRISIYFYNDEKDIDALVEALKEGDKFLDAYFN